MARFIVQGKKVKLSLRITCIYTVVVATFLVNSTQDIE